LRISGPALPAQEGVEFGVVRTRVQILAASRIARDDSVVGGNLVTLEPEENLADLPLTVCRFDD